MPKPQQNWLVLGSWPQPGKALLARGSQGHDREDTIARDLFKEILSECVEYKTYATDQFWLLAKHVRQMEVFIFAVSGGSFPYSLPLPFSSHSHKLFDQSRETCRDSCTGRKEQTGTKPGLGRVRVQ